MEDKTQVNQEVPTVSFPVDVTAKGVKTFVIWMDELQLDETGMDLKNGKILNYYKFKIIPKK